MKPIGKTLSRITKPILQEKGGVFSTLYLSWSRIVGKTNAEQCLPYKLIFPKKDQTCGVLTIQASGPTAALLHYKLPAMMDKINGFLGYKVIERITILQKPIPAVQTKEMTLERITLDPAEHAIIQEMTAIDENPELQDALQSFAQSYLKAQKYDGKT